MNRLLTSLCLAGSLATGVASAADEYRFTVCASDKSKLCYDGKPVFLSGMNVAWFKFSQDVGRQGKDGALLYVDENVVRKTFQDVRAAGGNTVRWWLYTNLAMDPYFDADNKTAGIETSTIANVKTILDIAKEYGLVVSICLLSFDMAKKTQYSANVSEGWSRYNFEANHKILTDTTFTRAFIDKAVLPLVKLYKNHPALLTWEVFNEPEGMSSTDNFGNGWGTELYPMSDIQRVVNMVADAIHTEAPANLVSNGSAKFNMTSDVGGTNYYTDAKLLASGGQKYPKGTLDFYQVHYYPEWTTNAHNPFAHKYSYWNLDKPMIIGEFPGADWMGTKIAADRRLTIMKAFENAYDSGYAGALAWTIVGGETEAKGVYEGAVWSLDSCKAALTNLFTKYESAINLDPSVKIENKAGQNGWMKVQYTDIPKDGSQLMYAKSFNLTGATSVSMTVKNEGTAPIQYMFVFKTGAADQWGWYQSSVLCDVAAGETKTCSYKLAEIAKWNAPTSTITTKLSMISEMTLAAFGLGYTGTVLIDKIKTDQGVFLQTFDTEFDVFSPTGTAAKTMAVSTYFDGTPAVDVSTPSNPGVSLQQGALPTQSALRVVPQGIELYQSKAGFVTIELLNLHGQRQSQIHQGYLEQGVHQFSLKHSAAGTWVVRLRSAQGAQQNLLLQR